VNHASPPLIRVVSDARVYIISADAVQERHAEMNFIPTKYYYTRD
jgi:hypothetical protein